MRIVVFGTGAIGGFFGGRLSAAGEDVVFVARGATLQALRTGGLRIVSPDGDAHIDPVNATDDPATIDFADLVLLCTKCADTDAAAAAIRPLTDRGAFVISLQNGVDAEDRLQELLGADKVAGGCSYAGVTVTAPGTVTHMTKGIAKLVFAELDGRQSDRVQAFAAACERAGIGVEVPDDFLSASWRKFLFLEPMASACCFYRAPIGAVLEAPERRDMLLALIGEAVAVARAEGADLPEDVHAQLLTACENLPAGVKPSMLADLEHGRRLELDWLAGAVLRRATPHGIAVPRTAEAYDALEALRDGAA